MIQRRDINNEMPKMWKGCHFTEKASRVDENGNPVLNEYAICKDCKKQWNLDKQRAKKSAPKPAASVAKHNRSSSKAGGAKSTCRKNRRNKSNRTKENR